MPDAAVGGVYITHEQIEKR